jgi:hypothetical protein
LSVVHSAFYFHLKRSKKCQQSVVGFKSCRGLACFLQNGAVIRDDVHGCRIPSIEKFKNIVDVENTWPLTFVEQWSLTEVTAELSASCYAGVLMLRAMGLGGWMFNGMDPFPDLF